MRKALFVMFLAAALGFSTFAHATLQNNGNGLIYDADLDITWYDAPAVARNWADSIAWAASLSSTTTIADSWHLPSTVDDERPNVWGYNGTTKAGYNITTSEMGHLYYAELRNKGYFDTSGNPRSGYGLVNAGPFINLQPNHYWSGTEYSMSTSYAWEFYFNSGAQSGEGAKYSEHYALAVHSGNVGGSSPSPVPIPGAILLFGPGLAGIAAKGRRFAK
ncbi:MAG: hypothetical protein NT010_13090 [Proteobacteria bacterium]|nr:hypothetical protein [Pseudomonadota bacterium]